MCLHHVHLGLDFLAPLPDADLPTMVAINLCRHGLSSLHDETTKMQVSEEPANLVSTLTLQTFIQLELSKIV